MVALNTTQSNINIVTLAFFDSCLHDTLFSIFPTNLCYFIENKIICLIFQEGDYEVLQFGFLQIKSV